MFLSSFGHYYFTESFRVVYPRAYRIHKLINQPDNVKRFIIGRQFCTVLTGFLLAQIFTFANFPNPGYDPIAFFIIIKSGLVGVLIVLAFGQLMPELLAAEFPLRFLNMPGTVAIIVLRVYLFQGDCTHIYLIASIFHVLTRLLHCMLRLPCVRCHWGGSLRLDYLLHHEKIVL